jgi:hypothetical protein
MVMNSRDNDRQRPDMTDHATFAGHSRIVRRATPPNAQEHHHQWPITVEGPSGSRGHRKLQSLHFNR